MNRTGIEVSTHHAPNVMPRKVENLPMYYYTWRGGAFCLQLGEGSGHGEKKHAPPCMWAMNGRNQPAVTYEPIEFGEITF